MPVNPDTGFDIQAFFPYQVRIFYRAVTDAVAQIYGSMFDLSVSEWRVLAVLSSNNVLSAGEIVSRSSMTKVNVSRAIKTLQKSGLLMREINGDDKRFAALRLTSKGKQVFATLHPHITNLEKAMFDGFSETEIALLYSMMERVRENADHQRSAFEAKTKL